MNKLAFLVLGLVAGAVAASAVAQENGSGGALGVIPSHEVREDFEMSVGVTAGDRPRRESRIVQHRLQVNLPQHYGALISVTQEGARTVLWYRDEADTVRNAVLEDAAGTLYTIVPTRTKDVEIERRK